MLDVKHNWEKLTSEDEHQDPLFVPTPRYFIRAEKALSVQLAIKDITSTTNARSINSCLIPPYAAGHTLPIIDVEIANRKERADAQSLLCANLNSVILDFVARTKILSNHASWFILEQLPVVPPERYSGARFGKIGHLRRFPLSFRIPDLTPGVSRLSLNGKSAATL